MFSFFCNTKKLNQLLEGNKELLKGFNRMAGEYELLKAEVAETSAKIDEVIAFIRANASDPVALKAFADELDAGQVKLTEAMGTVTPVTVTPVLANRSITQAEKDAKEAAGDLAKKQAEDRFKS